MKNFFEDKNKTSHLYSHGIEGRFLFGDNLRFVRNNVSGAGQTPSLGNSYVRQKTVEQMDQDTKEYVESAKPRDINGKDLNTERSITDETSTTIRSTAELEGLLRNGASGRTIDLRRSQVDPSVWMALARGEEVRVTLQQRAPERVNLFTPLFGSIMQVVGGLGGAAYNAELSSANNRGLSRAADFVQRHGTSYSLNPFGGGEHIDVDAVFSIVPKEKDKSQEHKPVDYTVKVPDLPNILFGRRINDEISPSDRFRGDFSNGDPRFFSSHGYRELAGDLAGASGDYKNHIDNLKDAFKELTTKYKMSPEAAAVQLGFQNQASYNDFVGKGDALFGANNFITKINQPSGTGNMTNMEKLMADIGINEKPVKLADGKEVSNMEDFLLAAAEGKNLTSSQKEAYNKFLIKIGETPNYSEIAGKNQDNFSKAVFNNNGLLPNRNDMAHFVFGEIKKDGTGKPYSGIVDGTSNGVTFADAYGVYGQGLETKAQGIMKDFNKAALGEGLVTGPEQAKAMVLLAYADKLKGANPSAAELHEIAEGLMDPALKPEDFARELATRLSSAGVTIDQAALAKDISDGNTGKLMQLVRQNNPKASFIEPNSNSTHNAVRAKTLSEANFSNDQVQFMALELVMRHKKGSDGQPVSQKMDGLIGPQHMTALQELMVNRAETLTDAAQVFNGEATFGRQMNEADWHNLAKALGFTTNGIVTDTNLKELQNIVFSQGSIDKASGADGKLIQPRYDDVLQALSKVESSPSLTNQQVDMIKTGLSVFQVQMTDKYLKETKMEELSPELKTALTDAIDSSSIAPDKKAELKALINGNGSLHEFANHEAVKNNKKALLAEVGKEFDNLTAVITDKSDSMKLELHPEIRELAREIVKVKESIVDISSGESEGNDKNTANNANQQAVDFQREVDEALKGIGEAVKNKAKNINGRPVDEVVKELETKYQQFIMMGFPVDEGTIAKTAENLAAIHTAAGLKDFGTVRDGFILAAEANRKADYALTNEKSESRTDNLIIALNKIDNSDETPIDVHSPAITKRMIERLPENHPIKENMQKIMQDDTVTNEELSQLFSAMGSIGEESAKQFFAIAERLLKHANDDVTYSPDLTGIYDSFRAAGKDFSEALTMTLASAKKAVPVEARFEKFVDNIHDKVNIPLGEHAKGIFNDKTLPPSEKEQKSREILKGIRDNITRDFEALPAEMKAEGAPARTAYENALAMIDRQELSIRLDTVIENDARSKGLTSGDLTEISKFAHEEMLKIGLEYTFPPRTGITSAAIISDKTSQLKVIENTVKDINTLIDKKEPWTSADKSKAGTILAMLDNYPPDSPLRTKFVEAIKQQIGNEINTYSANASQSALTTGKEFEIDAEKIYSEVVNTYPGLKSDSERNAVGAIATKGVSDIEATNKFVAEVNETLKDIGKITGNQGSLNLSQITELKSFLAEAKVQIRNLPEGNFKSQLDSAIKDAEKRIVTDVTGKLNGVSGNSEANKLSDAELQSFIEAGKTILDGSKSIVDKPVGTAKTQLENAVAGAERFQRNSSHADQLASALHDSIGNGWTNRENKDGANTLLRLAAKQGVLGDVIGKLSTEDKERAINLLSGSDKKIDQEISAVLSDSVKGKDMQPGLNKVDQEIAKNPNILDINDFGKGFAQAAGLFEGYTALTFARAVNEGEIDKNVLLYLKPAQISGMVNYTGSLGDGNFNKTGQSEKQVLLDKMVEAWSSGMHGVEPSGMASAIKGLIGVNEGGGLDINKLDSKDAAYIAAKTIQTSEFKAMPANIKDQIISEFVKQGGGEMVKAVIEDKSLGLTDKELALVAKHADGDKMVDYKVNEKDTVASHLLTSMIKNFNSAEPVVTLDDIEAFINEVDRDWSADDDTMRTVLQMLDGSPALDKLKKTEKGSGILANMNVIAGK